MGFPNIESISIFHASIKYRQTYTQFHRRFKNLVLQYGLFGESKNSLIEQESSSKMQRRRGSLNTIIPNN